MQYNFKGGLQLEVEIQCIYPHDISSNTPLPTAICFPRSSPTEKSTGTGLIWNAKYERCSTKNVLCLYEQL